ncbi:MAG TPA: AraC family transcriptional regulator [Clostridiales bacterium]|nr:AraC family transcriptional regulator [Clostridiales bacterium]
MLPKAWEGLLKTADCLPFIIHTIERVFDASWSMDPNRHDYFEMVYMKKGDAVFHIAGQPVDLEPNDVVIIKPERLHKFIVKSPGGCEFTVMGFKFENSPNTGYSEVSLEDFLNFVQGGEFGDYITLRLNEKNEIISLLHRILREREHTEPGSEFLNYLLIMEMFVLLSRALKMAWEDSLRGKSSRVRPLIAQAIRYMESRYTEEISPGEVARYVFLSHSYFTRAFREVTGMSPLSYILKLRIDKAEQLLLDTELKVGEIAHQVGFSSQQRFCEIFRKQRGMTPLTCRRGQKP